ncbi:hypothetical protein PV328_000530, partial [Microctonus aethiopoides]
MIDLKKEVGSRRWDKVCNKGNGNHGEYAAAAAATTVHEKQLRAVVVVVLAHEPAGLNSNWLCGRRRVNSYRKVTFIIQCTVNSIR